MAPIATAIDDAEGDYVSGAILESLCQVLGIAEQEDGGSMMEA